MPYRKPRSQRWYTDRPMDTQEPANQQAKAAEEPGPRNVLNYASPGITQAVVLARFPEKWLAQLASLKLEAEGIGCFIVGERPPIGIYDDLSCLSVSSDDLPRAIEILSQTAARRYLTVLPSQLPPARVLPAMSCPKCGSTELGNIRRDGIVIAGIVLLAWLPLLGAQGALWFIGLSCIWAVLWLGDRPKQCRECGHRFDSRISSEENKMNRLTRAQVREVDRRAIEQYHIPGIVLMENAARAVAAQAESMLGESGGNNVLILCGGGNNGGDGLAAARHLHNRGLGVTIGLCTDPDAYKGDALINWQVVQAMGISVLKATPETIATDASDLIVDAIFGTGLNKPPRPPFDQIVAAVETAGKPVLAVDLPSGLDCDTGQALGPCINAAWTVTFVAEKVGFGNPSARQFTGEITVADIGCPRELIQAVITS